MLGLACWQHLVTCTLPLLYVSGSLEYDETTWSTLNTARVPPSQSPARSLALVCTDNRTQQGFMHMYSQVLHLLGPLWLLAILAELCYADWPNVRKCRVPLPFAVFDGPLANLVACVLCVVAVSAQITLLYLDASFANEDDTDAPLDNAASFAWSTLLGLCFFYELVVFFMLLTYATFSGSWVLEDVLA